MLPITASARRSVFMLLASAGSVHHAARSAAAQSAPPPGHVLARVRVDAAAAVTSSARASAPDTASDAAYPLDRIAAVAPVDEAAFARTFSHRTAAVGDGTMHHVTGGRGPVVVLLHGWPEDWSSWRKVMPALAERYTLIVPDLRGFGDSEKPAGPYDNRTAAEDVYQLARALGHPRFDLVGHDVGAPVAYGLAAGHGDAVRRLVLFEGLPLGFSAPGGEGGASAVWRPAFHAVRGLPETLVAGREKAYLSYFFRTFTYDSTTFDDAEIEAYARACEPRPCGSPVSLAALLGGLACVAGSAAAATPRVAGGHPSRAIARACPAQPDVPTRTVNRVGPAPPLLPRTPSHNPCCGC